MPDFEMPFLDAMIAKPQLLIVAEQSKSIKIICKCLESEYQVIFANDYSNVVKFCRYYRIELVLIAMTLPRSIVFNIQRKIKESPLTRHIPIIFETKNSVSIMEMCDSHNKYVSCIAQPIDPEVLLAVVEAEMLLDLKFSISRLKKYGIVNADFLSRERFERQLATEWSIALQRNLPLSLILLKVNNLIECHDIFGLNEGFLVIRHIAFTLISCLRPIKDSVADFGGCTFAGILPGVGGVDAKAIAGDIMSKFHAHPISDQSNGQDTQFYNLSLGVASCAVNCKVNIVDFRDLAVNLLKLAQKEGGNRVCCESLDCE